MQVRDLEAEVPFVAKPVGAALEDADLEPSTKPS